MRQARTVFYYKKFLRISYNTESPDGRDAHAAQRKRLLKAAPRRREKAGKPLMIRGELRRACPLFLQEMGCLQKKNRDAKISLWCIGAPGRGILLLNLEEQKEA